MSTACLTSLLFVLVLQWLYKGGKIQQLEWDISTVTAGDYTVEFDIPAAAYRRWYEDVYKQSGGEYDQGYSPALSLKRTMCEQIETALKAEVSRRITEGDTQLHRKTTEEKQLNENVAIADMVFSYNNSALIHALRDRGNYIALQKFDLVQKQDAFINALFSDFESLTRPTACFITFEEEDATIVALNLKSSATLLGEKMRFRKASEPTDIIWENRHFTTADYFFRQLVAYTIIGVLLFGSFAFIYKVARTSAEIAREFPHRDCTAIESTYGSQLQRYAVEDYDFVVENDGLPSSGALQCFCKAEMENNYDAAMSSTYGHPQKAKICSEYQSIAFEVFVWLNSLKYFITGVNFVLRTVCIKLVAWIGYPTETAALLETTKVTFAVQFFNTAFLLLLVNADLSEQPFSFGLTGGT